MRVMSFSLTTPQFRARTKTVTRRLGWNFLAPGDRLCAVVKAMGLKKGESPQGLGIIEVRDVRRERLDAITADDVEREGFPGMTPEKFVEMFCRHMKATPTTIITRIEFVYRDASANQEKP